MNVETAMADVNGKFTLIDNNASNFPMRFYRFMAP